MSKYSGTDFFWRARLFSTVNVEVNESAQNGKVQDERWIVAATLFICITQYGTGSKFP